MLIITLKNLPFHPTNLVYFCLLSFTETRSEVCVFVDFSFLFCAALTQHLFSLLQVLKWCLVLHLPRLWGHRHHKSRMKTSLNASLLNSIWVIQARNSQKIIFYGLLRGRSTEGDFPSQDSQCAEFLFLDLQRCDGF